ncbi:MAG: aryl-sulfate sulfotransferase [Gammaproteobacteria bacterium]|nr:aryl-sulfate sulfotransferase [Gammaproteobacteria bacterium]
MLACWHDDDAPPLFTVTVDPTIALNPSGSAPLTASVSLATDQPTRAILAISSSDSAYTVEFLTPVTNHSLPVLGLKANRAYSIDITLVDEFDRQLALDSPLTVMTDPLPDDMAAIELIHSDPERMEPGFTLLDRYFKNLSSPGLPWPGAYTVIVDDAAEIVWYSEKGGWPSWMENGSLFYRGDNNVVEVDLLGNEVSRLPLEYDGVLHHELRRSRSDTWLSLAREIVTVDNYPTSYTDPDAPTETVQVLDEYPIEFDADGAVLRQWPMTEMIHPQRITYQTLEGTYPGGPKDWAHANAVFEDARDNTLLVSLRNQDAIVKFHPETGEIKWILGTHDNWPAEFQQYLLQPVGSPFEWFYHQHAPIYTPSGTILVYDNGNFRTSPYSGIEPLKGWENYSRGVEYEIDEDAMTVRQVWEYRGESGETIFAPAHGDTDPQPQTGNVLLTHGFVIYTDGGASSGQGYGQVHSRIVEVTRDATPERVFDMRISPSESDTTVLVYRSERVPSLYSPDVAISY